MEQPGDQRASGSGAEADGQRPKSACSRRHTPRSPAAPTRPDRWNRAVDARFRTVGLNQEFRCPECEYDLRGLPAPGGFFRCPECGMVSARHKAMVRDDQTTWWERRHRPVFCLALLAALALLLVLDQSIYRLMVSIPMAILLVWSFTQRLSDAPRQLRRRPPVGPQGPRMANADRALFRSLLARPEERDPEEEI